MSFLVFLPASIWAATQSLPIDFVRNQIWFSKQPFSGGEQVKIYTSVSNSSLADARGSVEFYDGKTLLGTTQFSVVAGGSQIVSVRWTATTGSHVFQAKITSMRAVYPDGREELVPDIATGSPLSVTVAAPAVSSVPSAADVAQLASVSGILRALDPGPVVATSTLSQQVTRGVVVAASSTDALLSRTHAALEAAKIVNDKKIALAKAANNANASSINAATLSTPFLILYSYLLHFLAFIFGNKIILYVAVAYLLYKSARLTIRRFF